MAMYAKQLPVDRYNNPFTGASPAFPSNASQGGSPIASSVITLSDLTTVVEFTSVGGPILLKWGPGSVTSSNFDNVVGGGQTRILVVPQSVMANSNSVMGANGANGLYNSVSVKTTAASSIATIYTSEF